jgi:PAS domain S-box-containing protein
MLACGLIRAETRGGMSGFEWIARARTRSARMAGTQAPAAGELQHRLFFEHNPLPMLVYDRATLRVVAASNAAVAAFGYTRAALLTMTVRDLTPPEDRDALDGHLASHSGAERPGPRTLVGRVRRRDGSVIDVEVSGDDVDLAARPCRIVLFVDVTERNRATAALLAAREEHRLLFEHNPQPIVVFDCTSLEIVAVSRAAIETTGWSREEFLSMTLLDLAPQDEHAAMLDYVARSVRDEPLGYRAPRPRRHVCKDGRILDVEVTSADVVINGRRCRVCLCLDVTERNRQAAELAAARDAAIRASALKSTFLANMSHEIRTPMNGVIGMTELLLEAGLDGEQREYAEQIARSGEQMLAIINDILDLSKIETGRLELEIAPFSLHDAIHRACGIASAPARSKGLELRVEIAEQVPARVQGDGRRLAQVVLNLVANAIKFTPSGSVTVRVGASGERVRIEVIDSGIGIDPERVEDLFEPFVQADASTTRLYGGSGLGLAIARELVELMGGTIAARPNPGAGSTFSVELDLPAEEGDAALAPAPATLALAATLWSAPPLVLVAEDSQINQIVATRALERCGCRVEVVSDGAQALAALASQRFDLVLMDCQMPGMDGYEATAELRRREAGLRRTPVVAMTAQAMDGDRRRCLAAGMDDYVTKPLRRDELAGALGRWIPSAAARQGHAERSRSPGAPRSTVAR